MCYRQNSLIYLDIQIGMEYLLSYECVFLYLKVSRTILYGGPRNDSRVGLFVERLRIGERSALNSGRLGKKHWRRCLRLIPWNSNPTGYTGLRQSIREK